jgi:multidrug efflux system outer membrane protein
LILVLLSLAFGAEPPTPGLAWSDVAQGRSGDVEPSARWWDTFGMAAYVDRGLAASPDLAAADARVVQARAAAWASGTALLPGINADLSGTTAPRKQLGFQFGGFGGPPPEGLYETASATITAQWQPDLFGRTTTTFQAANLDAKAAEADRDQLANTLAGTLATAWLDAVAARERQSLAEAQLAQSARLLELVELRLQHGGSTALDVLQQRQQTATADANLARLVLAREVADQQLAALIGEIPSRFDLPVDDALPPLPPAPSIGAATSLSLARPDLRAASLRLDAASRRRLSATLGLAPTPRLQISGGRSWFITDQTVSQNQWSASGGFSIPILNGGRQHAAIRQASAVRSAAEADLRRRTADAIGQVEGALAQEASAEARSTAVTRQLAAARLAYDEAKARYLAGTDPFVNVLVSEGSLFQAELAAVDAYRDRVAARIRLHVALGTSAEGEEE